MKGTFFSADFIIDESNNIKVLEFNTDTGIISETLDTQFNFTDFINVLSSNNITKISIVYKIFHRTFVDKLTEVIGNDATFITEIQKVEEDISTIYPTSITDEDDRFILRLVYDENAIFDSTYCKQRIEVLKLFHDNDATGSIPEFRYSGSNWDNTESSSIDINNNDKFPDLAVKDSSERQNPLRFVRLQDTENSSSAELIDDYWWNYLDRSDSYIEKYHINPTQDSNNKVQAIREFGILYGSNVDYVKLCSYKIDSMLSTVDLTSYSDTDSVHVELPRKHYFEYTTNFIREGTSGVRDAILDSEKIIKQDGTFVYPSELQVSSSVQSFFVSGSSDTDNVDIFISWSYSGNTLPIGSEVTESVIEQIQSGSSTYQTGIELVLNGGDRIYLEANKHLLTYNSGSNKISYKPSHGVMISEDYLFTTGGVLIPISQSNYYIGESTDYPLAYRVDVEQTDTYIVSASSPFIVHNAPCFVAGTKVHIEDKGITNIEDVEVGDKVISYNHNNDTVEYKEVLKVRTKENENVVTYVFENGTELTGTPDHPLFVNGKGYSSYYPKQTKDDSGLDVEQILLGDEVLHMDGYGVTIIDIIENEETQVVYNLDEVDTNNNFFANDLLAHNRQSTTDPFIPETCFAAGTEISLENGDTKNIEDIVVGDEVLGWNGEEIESAIVTDIDHRHTVGSHAAACKTLGDEPSLYTINDTGIEFTLEHPFLTKEGWKSLVPDPNQEPYKSEQEPKPLRIGDWINKDGEWIEIDDIRIVRSDSEEKVYNITVDKLHSYIANGIIVHNK